MSESASPADVADALLSMSMDAAAADPAVRRADWRRGQVTAVGSTGTVTVDGMTIRRHITYQNPQVGDWAVLVVSGGGYWLALGPLAGTTDHGGAWVSPTLAAGYTNGASSTPVLGTVQYRKVVVSGQTFMQWRGGVSWATSGTAPNAGNILSVALATTFRPAAGQRTTPIAAGGAVVKFDALGTGVMAIVNPAGSGLTTWASFHGVQYTID